MQVYESKERIIQKLPPLRPRRQKCVVSASGAYAVNLPADFLTGVILLGFDSPDKGSSATTEKLFPNDIDDLFLRALKTSPYAQEHLTDFFMPRPRLGRSTRSLRSKR